MASVHVLSKIILDTVSFIYLLCMIVKYIYCDHRGINTVPIDFNIFTSHGNKIHIL